VRGRATGNELRRLTDPAVGFSHWLAGDIQSITPSRRSKGSGELVRQHCRPGHENKSNDRPRPNPLPFDRDSSFTQLLPPCIEIFWLRTERNVSGA
jgi:hypothetical protein